jgi:hypothetical protein
MTAVLDIFGFAPQEFNTPLTLLEAVCFELYGKDLKDVLGTPGVLRPYRDIVISYPQSWLTSSLNVLVEHRNGDKRKSPALSILKKMVKHVTRLRGPITVRLLI